MDIYNKFKNVKITQKSPHRNIGYGTLYIYENYNYIEKNYIIRLIRDVSMGEGVSLSIKSGLQTIMDNPGAVAGAAAVSVVKSIAAGIMRNPSTARHAPNDYAKDLKRYYANIKQNNEDVIWEQELKNVSLVELLSGKVGLCSKNGFYHCLTFDGERKAEKWFNAVREISGMRYFNNMLLK